MEKLPPLDLSEEKHQPLVECLSDYPLLFEIFTNIHLGRPALFNTDTCRNKSLPMLSEGFFLPLLEKHGAITKDNSTPSGYKPLVSEIAGAGIDPKFVLRSACNLGVELGKDADNASRDNTFAAIVQTEIPVTTSRQVLEQLRGQAIETMSFPTENGGDCKRFRVAIMCQIGEG